MSVAPVTAIVIILNFTLVPLGTTTFVRFLIGAALVVIGLSIFLFGNDIGISPIGNLMGSHLTRSNRVWIVIAGGLALGFFISIAEPDLQILADQVALVTGDVISKMSILIVVSVGIAVMMTLGLLRIFYKVSLTITFLAIYLVILLLSVFTPPSFLAIAFDASGATTGALTVPFMLALAMGVSLQKKETKDSGDDSFGLVGVTSSGAIIAVAAMSLIIRPGDIAASIEVAADKNLGVFAPYISQLPISAMEIAIALSPLLAIFFIFQFISFKLRKRALMRIVKGIIYTFIGLVIFMTGVHAGFMEVGTLVGMRLAEMPPFALIIVGLVLGLSTILAEPAVYVLTKQIEDATSGYVKRSAILVALSAGVGAAVALSVVRILIPGLQLWHYLLPGYIIAVGLMFIAPKLFIGMAFDAGGVASGPITATFILAFAQGAAEAIEGADVLIDGFGVIAMVAMMPIITLQLLGLIFKHKSRKEGISTNGNQDNAV